MRVINSISGLREYLEPCRKKGKTIGFVPTMGYFHEGHLSLMRQARKDCDVVVVSIFVNPIQFGAGEDYEEYPRDIDRDSKLAEKVGVDVIFAPAVREMYPEGYSTFVEVENLTEGLCGRSRPGHFRGVTTVVTKLFNIVQPDKAYFGQKDAQQAMVIRKMVADLNMPLEVIVLPTVREADGLAMSSRNVYLTPEQRKSATVLYRSLQLAKNLIEAGERSVAAVVERVKQEINAEPLAKIDYVEIRRADDLAQVEKIEGKILIALAVFIGKTRLIDNEIVEVQ
ncbi:pantoate--beta-alanine ligase [Calderihabitans maritimus]|uniref:Pantothenate synthetase n=1 Tax=Calderihabitans maritimus TaxID=1246530 RepID=A0A1Z5HRQ9_9FIRM|nr:pantoate--beta-alanine ligase [Calderihabitans maritimus]GAW92212.1 panthothenate synthetase [Calderihabitans maritimus]